MGREAAESVPSARALFDQANNVLGYDLAKLCFEGPTEKLNSTVHSQPALFVTSLAALEVLRGKSPDTIAACESAAGLSLGEYTAMVFAGAMEFEPGLNVVQRRGEAMQAASDARASGMVSVLGLEVSRIEELCDRTKTEGEILQIANLLCPDNVAVSGDLAACERLAKAATEAGAMKAVTLAVAGAFHTPIMQSAVEKLAEALSGIEMSVPRVPVISNVDAIAHTDPEEMRDLLVKQVVSPVQWEKSMRHLLANGFDTFYEIGPGRVLRGLLRRVDRKINCENVTG
jgi:[acyl-carrier-protein] S-malonyltransferase